MIEALTIAAVVGVVGWVFKLGDRVTILERDQKGLVELINTRFDTVDDRLERIERNQDSD